MTARAQLAEVFAPGVVRALVELVEGEVEERLGDATGEGREWYTVEEAAKRLDCSPKAIRARYYRGRLVGRHQGRRLYLSAESVDAR